MSGVTEICNNALGLVGAQDIIGIDDRQSEEARLCRLHYPQVRDVVLRAHEWKSAMAEKELALKEEAPLLNYSRKYDLPTDPYCLRVVQLNQRQDRYTISGRFLHTNAANAIISFIQASVPGNWDPLLIEAMSIRLASKLAWPLTQKRAWATQLREEYVALDLPLATSVDSMEVDDPIATESEWINSRVNEFGGIS